MMSPSSRPLHFDRIPKTTPCRGCGKPFFSQSLPIHQRSCEGCLKQTPPRRRRTDRGTALVTAAAAAPTAFSNNDDNDIDNDNDNDDDGDGGVRPRCRFCFRGFARHRIAKHEQICGKLKQARADLKPAQVFDSSAARMRGVVAPGGGVSYLFGMNSRSKTAGKNRRKRRTIKRVAPPASPIRRPATAPFPSHNDNDTRRPPSLSIRIAFEAAASARPPDDSDPSPHLTGHLTAHLIAASPVRVQSWQHQLAMQKRSLKRAGAGAGGRGRGEMNHRGVPLTRAAVAAPTSAVAKLARDRSADDKNNKNTINNNNNHNHNNNDNEDSDEAADHLWRGAPVSIAKVAALAIAGIESMPSRIRQSALLSEALADARLHRGSVLRGSPIARSTAVMDDAGGTEPNDDGRGDDDGVIGGATSAVSGGVIRSPPMMLPPPSPPTRHQTVWSLAAAALDQKKKKTKAKEEEEEEEEEDKNEGEVATSADRIVASSVRPRPPQESMAADDAGERRSVAEQRSVRGLVGYRSPGAPVWAGRTTASPLVAPRPLATVRPLTSAPTTWTSPTVAMILHTSSSRAVREALLADTLQLQQPRRQPSPHYYAKGEKRERSAHGAAGAETGSKSGAWSVAGANGGRRGTRGATATGIGGPIWAMRPSSVGRDGRRFR